MYLSGSCNNGLGMNYQNQALNEMNNTPSTFCDKTILQATLTHIHRVVRFPTPTIWSKLLSLDTSNIAHLNRWAAIEDGTQWTRAPRPKYARAFLIFSALEKTVNKGPPIEDLPDTSTRNFGLKFLELVRTLECPHGWEHSNRLTDENRDLALRSAVEFPFWTLTMYSPCLAWHIYRLLKAEDITFKAIVSHVLNSGCQVHITAPLQGIAGAGKTYSMIAFAMTAALVADFNVVWTAKQNQPLIEAVEHVTNFRPGNGSSMHSAFLRILASQYKEKVLPPDVAYEDRRDFQWPSKCVLLFTSGIVASNIDSLPIIRNTLEGELDLLVQDEAQQYGQYDDALAIAHVADTALIALLGDQEQPIGAAPMRTQRLLLQKLSKLQPGLRCSLIEYRAPAAYLQHVHAFLRSLSSLPVDMLADPDNLNPSTVIQDLCEAVKRIDLSRSLSNYEKLGWGGFGGLTIPYSLRVTDFAYLLAALPTYFRLFPTWKAWLQNPELPAGYLAPFDARELAQQMCTRPFCNAPIADDNKYKYFTTTPCKNIKALAHAC